MNREKISSDDLPELMRILNQGTKDEQCRALRLLCPCRNRVYDLEIWQKIFRARESGDFSVQHQAEHAIETLRQRALLHLQSWELLAQVKKDLKGQMPTFSDELSKIESFYEEGWITNILFKTKRGKESTVYCCQSHPSTGGELLAAKAYYPRRSSGKKTRPPRGRQAQFIKSSAEREFATLLLLHAAGADVPKPISCSQKAVLMEWVGDHEMPAPLLDSVSLDRNEARSLFDLLIRNVELWLSFGWIHGDLSEFNILYWEGRVKVIDFSQAVDPCFAPNAFDILRRDIGNLCRYFGRYGIKAEPFDLADQIWTRYLRYLRRLPSDKSGLP